MGNSKKNITPEEYRLVQKEAARLAPEWHREELAQELYLFILEESYQRTPIFSGQKKQKPRNIWKKWVKYREESTGRTFNGKQVMMLRNEAAHILQALIVKRAGYTLSRKELDERIKKWWKEEEIQSFIAGLPEQTRKALEMKYTTTTADGSVEKFGLSWGTYSRRLDSLRFYIYSLHTEKHINPSLDKWLDKRRGGKI